MQLLELPLDILKIVIKFTVQELRLKSMKTRLTCRTFANEIFDAVITTRVIEDAAIYSLGLFRIAYHHNVIARYLYHRVCTDGSVTHPWITTIRETSQMLAQHTSLENDAARVELIERGACLCLAVNAGCGVFRVMKREEKDDRAQLEGCTWANCLAIAAWIGDKTLVEALNKGSDPPSFFGRPSWAAAAQGHADILQFFLDEGALPYEPTFVAGPNFSRSKSPLGAAAYMGQENTARLYIRPPYYCSETQLEEKTAVYFAAQGNQPTTLKVLLEHCRENSTPQEFLSIIDGALVWSCRRGATICAQILLDYGADVNESDTAPRSCLQLAVIAGNAPIVKMLLDAGASLEADGMVHRRSSTILTQRKRQKDALTEAYRRDNTAIIKMIEDRRELIREGLLR
ncbi:uncharacterized protein BP5553_05988 [Venustampulla echinocandica]|uniref:Uncharacterized protein n=1 Tax=Venustampulla echinocandica TaxID=2656787 RepID=A0A370TM81_9HELO|nr:uncharacterized protein BP5553_05988 [Venustampulla echinocandica]RDL36636.1 hypothetical protein BP5553_05988 [Venustampulla echinocandica]